MGDSDALRAMARVRREDFMPESMLHLTYEDIALSIGEGQTISQPYIVAMMVKSLELRPSDRTLEIGTGSGYQAAVLAELCGEVISVERIQSLADLARRRLQATGYKNVRVCPAGPTLGRPEEAPYDAIIVAAAAPRVPREVMDQLAAGGRLVIPVGSLESQDLTRVTRTGDGFAFETFGPCRFVPLIGEGAWSEHELDEPESPP